MGKRYLKQIRRFFLLLVMAVSMLPIGTKTVNAEIKLEQVGIVSPTITTYLTGGGAELKPEKLTPELVYCDTILTYNKDAHIYQSESDGGTEYIYVVEISKYVTKKQRKSIITALGNVVNLLKKSDTMTVYTFGDTFSSASPVKIKGGAALAERKAAKEKIRGRLKRKEKTSHLWNAMTNILEKTKKSSDKISKRRVAVFVTGGNYKKSTSNNDKNDVKNQLKTMTKNIACYMIQLKTKCKVDGSEASVFTENGGRKYAEKSDGGISGCFKKFQSDMKNTVVASFRAADNTVFDGGGTVSLKIDDTRVCEKRVVHAAYAWQENEETPVVLPLSEGGGSRIRQEDANSISFTFSEPVRGAEAIKNYKITRNNGEKAEIASLRYDVSTNRCQIVFEDELFTDEYTLTLSGITDIDHDAHLVEPSQISFTIEGRNEQVYKVLTFLKMYWWMILIGVIVLILLIAYLVIRSHGGIVEQGNGKKGFANATTVTVGISTPKTKQIMLTMTDSYGKSKEIVCNIDSSIFVGRDKMCQIHTDDDKMSRQHFVIESTQLGFFVTDLETMNGTFVNGSKLTQRQLLNEGDAIVAGREKFVFHVMKENNGTQRNGREAD